MDDPEKKKIVLGSLLNAAGAAAKRVISSYSPEKTYKANMKALKACKAAPLEECATLLGFTCREADKKLYRNITILTDRIILKIEALFEIHCDDCNETYSNTLEDEPPLTCRLCMQGSHNCDPVKEKMKTLKPIMEAENLPSGMVWLCHECKKKNDLSFLQPVMPTTLANNQGAENKPEEDDIDKDEEEEEEEERRISPRRGRDLNDAIPKDAIPKDVTSKENVCEMYKRRQCPHGRTGKTLVEGLPCSKSHPPRCRRFCDYGPKSSSGCNRGKNCRYWHPRLCRHSLADGRCLQKDTCTFFHLKGTVRTADVPAPKERKDNPWIKENRRREEKDQLCELPSLLLRDPETVSRNIRFSSITSQTPYPPTVASRRTEKHPEADTSSKDSSAFLLKLIESMKEGIISHIDKQISELRSSIPQIVRQLVPTNNTSQLPQQNPCFNQQFQQMMPPHTMPPHMIPSLYQASSY